MLIALLEGEEFDDVVRRQRVGTALMELGKLAGLKMYGTASPGKHDVLISFGVTPIDYHTHNIAVTVRSVKLCRLRLRGCPAHR